MATTQARTERKQWASEHFRGFENIHMPSFTPDMQAMDEAGIRFDVRQSIRHGFFSTFSSGAGLGHAERKRCLEIVAEEARGKICVGFSLGGASKDESLDLLQHAERVGCTHVLVSYPHDRQPESEEEVYVYLREYVDATNLAVVLWATESHGFRRFHPSNVPWGVYNRLADLPNVVALKLMTILDPGAMFECFEQFSDRLLIGPVNLTWMPMLAKHYRVQWSGAWTQEALQSPEQPYAVEFFNHLQAGRFDAAMKLYWQIAPAVHYLYRMMGPLLARGLHPWPQLKYYQWCVGGNGGIPRERGIPPEAEEIKAAYRAIGLTPSEPDEMFLIGRTQWEQGVRAKDLASVPAVAH